MVEKIFRLLFICGILCFSQILAAESSDQLVRRKRVINLEPDGDVPLQTGDAPYVVNIRRNSNNNSICVGTILTKHTVITVANCVASLAATSIHIRAGSTYYHLGERHNVITKNIHIGNHERRFSDGIALLAVDPPIIFDTRKNKIELFQGILLPGTPVTIFGWGCNPTMPRGTNYRNRLRSITVPVMNQRECRNAHRNRFVISDNDVCTYHVNKRCGHTDVGAPLVVDNQLAALHLWGAQLQGEMGPDVFVLLQSVDYGAWIRNNIIHNVIHIRTSK